jgi:hypothetical protein
MPILETLKNEAFPIAAVRVWQGARMCFDSNANVVTIQAAGNANLTPCGIAAETVDNSAGSSGGAYCLVELDHEIVGQWLDNATGGAAVTALFTDAYGLDDHTVTNSSSGNSKAGRVLKLDPIKGVLVESYTL